MMCWWMFNNRHSERGRKKPWCVAFANFCHVHFLTAADFKVAMWYHWTEPGGDVHELVQASQLQHCRDQMTGTAQAKTWRTENVWWLAGSCPAECDIGTGKEMEMEKLVQSEPGNPQEKTGVACDGRNSLWKTNLENSLKRDCKRYLTFTIFSFMQLTVIKTF